MNKNISESDRREIYSQIFDDELFGYGYIPNIHSQGKFSPNNDDICSSYFFKKNDKWKKHISLGRKYAPLSISPQEAYKREGLAVEEPKNDYLDLNDSNETEEDQKDIQKKFDD